MHTDLMLFKEETFIERIFERYQKVCHVNQSRSVLKVISERNQ